MRRFGILVLMVIGTLGLAFNPVFALWLASQLAQTNAPVAGPYALTAVVVVVGTIVLAYLLGKLVDAYNHAVGHDAPPARHPDAWASSPPNDPGSITLSNVLLAAFAIAALAGGVWFYFFAGSSI